MSRSSNKVLIVGAGPVGLVTALRLNSFGIPCVVFEANDSLPQDLRASTFHPPTLDMLDEYAISDRLVSMGRICPAWQIRIHETHEYAEFDLSLIANETNHPYRLQCEQSKLCEILKSELVNASNVEFHFGATVKSLTQFDDYIEVDVDKSGERHTYTGGLLVAADGAKSQIRKHLGVNFEGVTYPETVILATTKFPFELHLPNLANVNYVWTEGSTFSLLHLPDRWRCSLYRDPDESVEDAIKPEAIQQKMQKIVTQAGDYDILDLRVYRVHMRIVDDYRVGRVVFAGDAAHVNSPSGGMGMNGGVHDAFALTEEINAIFNGAALDRLDAYTKQRLPIAKSEIMAQADKNRRRMQERDPVKRREIFKQLQRIASSDDLARAYLLNSSMITGLKRAKAIVAS